MATNPLSNQALRNRRYFGKVLRQCTVRRSVQEFRPSSLLINRSSPFISRNYALCKFSPLISLWPLWKRSRPLPKPSICGNPRSGWTHIPRFMSPECMLMQMSGVTHSVWWYYCSFDYIYSQDLQFRRCSHLDMKNISSYLENVTGKIKHTTICLQKV